MKNVTRVNLTAEEYHADKSRISASGLKIIAGQSLRHFKEQQEGGTEETAALLFGEAYHCYVLEQEMFHAKYILFDETNRTEKDKGMTSNKNKEWKANFYADAEAAGERVITREDYEKIVSMRTALFQNADIAALLTGGQAEVSFHFDVSGRGGKCRFDYISAAGDVAIDLKTTINAAPRAFGMDAYRRKYHIQAAWYSDVLSAERGGADVQFYYIAQEKTAPYIAQLYVVSPDVIQQGRAEYLAALEKLQTAELFDEWPAYENPANYAGARELFFPNFGYEGGEL